MSVSAHHSLGSEPPHEDKGFPVDFDKLQELIQLFQASDLAEIEVEEAGSRVRLRKAPDPPAEPSITVAAPHYPLQAPPPGALPPAGAVSPPAHANAGVHTPSTGEGITTITSPMVGVFYVAPSPNDPAFVQPGDAVSEGATVCIVEAMKLMNEVVAKFPCEIVEVLVENGEPVEFNQPLFNVRPLE